MKTYHFSCGDSTHGAVGLAGSVRARTKREALLSVRHALGNLVGSCGEVALHARGGSFIYVNVYITPENISETDMDVEN